MSEVKPTCLLPCPFCKTGEDELEVCIQPNPHGYWQARVQCIGCGVSVSRGYSQDISEVPLKAITAWNTRGGDIVGPK